jgi:hypothetical protein
MVVRKPRKLKVLYKKNGKGSSSKLKVRKSRVRSTFLRQAIRAATIVKNKKKSLSHPKIENKSDKAIGELNAVEISRLFNNAVKLEIEKKRKKGLSVALYDKSSGRAYLEKTDGSREYV